MTQTEISYAHQRGKIKESVVKALVTDPLFKCRVERNRKGKGSYQRNAKHKKLAYSQGETPFKKVQTRLFKWGFKFFYLLLSFS